jgi:Protein of unknown function (DUF2281)
LTVNAEQLLVEKWRSLPPVRKQEVIDFVEFLEARSDTKLVQTNSEAVSKPASNLGGKLQEIRNKIVSSSVTLLDCCNFLCLNR